MSRIKYFIILFVLGSTIILPQKVSIGFKLESLNYFYNNTIQKSSELSILPLPLSGYVKASLNIDDKYEAEIKGGAQLDDVFAGPEYAITFKYNLFKSILPLITYLKHFNSGDLRTGNGIYNNRIEFIGTGIEARLTKIFGVDLIYYIPIGDKGLEYTIEINTNKKITTTEMDSMIKLGFNININL